MAFSRRRAAEDKNTKHLRELASLPANKQCFDCLQRGPTYINVTIGSFVCTTCSGILRGLTPPHRVKSISMTTFTTEEIEYLKSKGNEYCKYVWLGTFDTSTNSIESEVSDDQRKRDFMIQKYEKKRWYIEPDIAVKKMQSDISMRPKQGVVQSQNTSTRSNIAETQPLSRLLGKSPTPLVVQNNQNTESWPHPVSSASAPTISTKTAAQNNGSRSIDWLSEFSGNASKPTAPAGPASNSTANGNFANFANFDNAFNSVEKSAAPPPLPTSASLDAYPMPRKALPPPFPQQSSRSAVPPPAVPPPFQQQSNVAVPPPPPQQSNADRYAALADLDSLFNQPASKGPSWTVETTSSAAVHEVPAASAMSTAPSNPFATSTELWSQPAPKSSFQSANPFQSDSLHFSQPLINQPFNSQAPISQPFNSQPPINQPFNSQPPISQTFNSQPPVNQPFNSQPSMTQPFNSQPPISQPFNSQPPISQSYTPFPMVGNSPSEDSVRSQFGTNFSPFQSPPAQVTSPTNGYGASQLLLNGGGMVSPTGPNQWSMPTNMPMWSSSQMGMGGLFGSDNKAPEPAQHADWIQNPVNPFAASSNNTGFPPKNNCSNPFL